VRPLVLLFTLIAFVVTLLFHADVDAQGGAYATSVLVLITSAAVAVTISAHRHRQRAARLGFGVITGVLLYTTVANVAERPDGVKIASFFIGAILVTSFASRVHRAFELRATRVRLDGTARRFVDEDAGPTTRIIANEPNAREEEEEEYREKAAEQREKNHLPADEPVLFLEVTVTDPSEFAVALDVQGEERFGYRILRVDSPTVPNGIAAVLLHLRDTTGIVPHAYFAWTEGSPITHLLRYLVVGEARRPR
jgi:hypothetical protein